jgi:hypothetical protein
MIILAQIIIRTVYDMGLFSFIRGTLVSGWPNKEAAHSPLVHPRQQNSL